MRNKVDVTIRVMSLGAGIVGLIVFAVFQLV
jgi:hypothetical protein